MNILLVDDHTVVRAGLGQLLAAALDATILEAADTPTALDIALRARPDLVVLDLGLPGAGGLWLLPRLRDAGLRVLVLSMHADPIYARRALDAGATGYVSKTIGAEALLDAIRQAMDGQCYVEAGIAALLSEHHDVLGRDFGRLTARDLDIMRFLGEGRSLSDIAATLGVSYKTVANTAGMIKTKLGVARTADLIRLAIATPAGWGTDGREGHKKSGSVSAPG